MFEKIVRISEFVPISEITLIQWGINYNKFALLEYQGYYFAMIAYLTRFLNLIDRFKFINVYSKHRGE